VRALLLEVKVCLSRVNVLLFEAKVLLLGGTKYLRGENISLFCVELYCFNADILLWDDTSACPIGNNSLSVDKELFLFRDKLKTRYSERERKETLEDRPGKRFWQGCFVN